MPQSASDIARMRLVTTMLLVSGLGGAAVAGEPIPVPPPRPPIAAQVPSSVSSAPTACDKRLQAEAVMTPLPRLIGPGLCGGGDMVELEAVLRPDHGRIAVEPAAVLNCAMAESLAGWLREEAAPRLARLGSPLTAVENYDAYECRSRDRIPGAKISEHAFGDAIDLRAFRLADGRRLELTDGNVDKSLREALRDSACHRFTTVLGPGADSYHRSHVHLDIKQRRGGYRICEWDVRDAQPPEKGPVPLPRPRPALAGAPLEPATAL
jgi:hypothetical protein